MTGKKLCSISEIPNNGVKTFKLKNKDIAIFNVEGEFFAIDRKCTHLKGNLAKGKIDGKTIQCPLHGAIFNLETGELTNPPGTLAGWFKKAKHTNVYKVNIKNEELFIEL